MTSISLILPVFQERGVLKRTLNEVLSVLRAAGCQFEIIVADDGSVDDSEAIVAAMMPETPELSYLRSEVNRGRGAMLMMAEAVCKFETICYIDADLQIPPETILTLARTIDAGYDIVVGSKHLPGSRLSYSQWRLIQSVTYNRIARWMLRVDVTDFQCGAKAFRRQVIRSIRGMLRCRRWSWDTEFLLKGILAGFQFAEVPVLVRRNLGRRSRVRLWDAFSMAYHLVRLTMWKRLGAEDLLERRRRAESG